MNVQDVLVGTIQSLSDIIALLNRLLNEAKEDEIDLIQADLNFALKALADITLLLTTERNDRNSKD